MTFELHPNLASKTFIADLPLCRVLLEDNKHFPWIFLVPRRANVSRIMDLSAADQLQWIKELDLAQNVFWREFSPTQINVAAIGNKTPQLHIHIIARYITDPAWPNTVWDHPSKMKYEPAEKEALIRRLQKRFE